MRKTGILFLTFLIGGSLAFPSPARAMGYLAQNAQIYAVTDGPSNQDAVLFHLSGGSGPCVGSSAVNYVGLYASVINNSPRMQRLYQTAMTAYIFNLPVTFYDASSTDGTNCLKLTQVIFTD